MGYIKMSAFKKIARLYANYRLVGHDAQGNNIQISFEDFWNQLDIEASGGGGQPIFFEGTQLPNENNTGEPLQKGDWLFLPQGGTYTNIGGGSPIETPGDRLSFGIYNGTTWSLVDMGELPIGKTIEIFNDTKVYNVGDQIYFGNFVFEIIETTLAGENPTTNPSKFRLFSLKISTGQPTLAILQTDIYHSDGSLAIVFDDPNPAYNGVYQKIGGAGAGGWGQTKLVNPLFAKPGFQSMAIGGGHMSIWGDEDHEGQANTAFGHEAGLNLGSCWATTLIGWKAGRSLSNASKVTTYADGSIGNTGNTFVGYNVGAVADGALDNTAVGTSAGENMTTCMDNALFGIWAGRMIQAGSENTLIGHAAGQFLVGKGKKVDIDNPTTDPEHPNYSWGHQICAVGDQAGRLNAGGNEHVYGRKSTYVGADTRASGDYVENENVFGHKAIGRGSNTLVLGNQKVEETSFHGILANWTDRRFEDLPTPNRYLVGARSFILDADTRVFDAVVSGGGSNLMPVWCDGSSWRIG